jgi:hypothetical protein
VQIVQQAANSRFPSMAAALRASLRALAWKEIAFKPGICGDCANVVQAATLAIPGAAAAVRLV